MFSANLQKASSLNDFSNGGDPFTTKSASSGAKHWLPINASGAEGDDDCEEDSGDVSFSISLAFEVKSSVQAVDGDGSSCFDVGDFSLFTDSVAMHLPTTINVASVSVSWAKWEKNRTEEISSKAHDDAREKERSIDLYTRNKQRSNARKEKSKKERVEKRKIETESVEIKVKDERGRKRNSDEHTKRKKKRDVMRWEKSQKFATKIFFTTRQRDLTLSVTRKLSRMSSFRWNGMFSMKTKRIIVLRI